MENPNNQVVTQQEFAAKFRSKQEVSATTIVHVIFVLQVYRFLAYEA